MFIDSHCHISKKYYNNIENLIDNNYQKGVEKIILSCCEKGDIEESIEILNTYQKVYATFGFHPDQIDYITDADIDLLKKIILSNKKIVGIGEIGLDYHYSTNKEKQKKLFIKQLNLANTLNMPVVIHSRDATEDTIEILKKYNLKGIIHCFSGSIEVANEYIKMGYKLGIGGVLTFKNSRIQKVMNQLSLRNIVLETDSPYLSPEPFRGNQNSSKNIPIIAKKISEIKNISIEEIEQITTENCYELFDLK